MKSLWNDQEASAFLKDPVQLRAYTSRLLGQEPSLVLHGGGNTSVKTKVTNIFGETTDVLYVKGSGWDLATIQPQGFAPVRMDVLMKMAHLEKLSDADMVREQKAAMIDPSAPGPSVEAILHAIIPFKYVDHTHADAVVTLTNTPGGEKKIRDLFGDRVLCLPYVMPGFILARQVFEFTRDIDWKKYKGIVLLNHGVFTFADEAKESYENMIQLITQAEDELARLGAMKAVKTQTAKSILPIEMASLRKEIGKAWGSPVIAKLDTSAEAVGFSSLKNVGDVATRGTVTPDHVIHTKPKPLIVGANIPSDVANYVSEYKKYFTRNNPGNLTCLDPAPRWAVWPEYGVVTFGATVKNAKVIQDVARHTAKAVQWGEALGGWTPLPEPQLFEVEYWELEQAKLKKSAGPKPALQGKVALVTGAASGIGKACVEMLNAQGAAVVALDINPRIQEIFNKPDSQGWICDVTDTKALEKALHKTVEQFGGLDLLVTNAGIFPPGKFIADMPEEDWDRSLNLNLTSHQRLLKACVPFLKLGFDPAVVVIASKNVPAPGPGAAAYSVAKAGLTQLARVAALELAPQGIRVNILHPDAVFDTGIWTEEVLANRAKHYGLSVDEYKRKNLLKTEITSKDVAQLACAMMGPAFAKTTGAQVPIDGGNDRVI